MIDQDVSWLAANFDVVLVAVLGVVGTVVAAVISKRGARDVAQLGAEQGAYTRASEIDAGVVERLQEERDYLRDELKAERDARRADREQWAQEKTELRGEVAELERRLREEVEAGVERQLRLSELLDEVARLRSRHDEDATPTT